MAFDLVIVTAANRAQARGYRAQLHAESRDFLVIPDPGDRRVGSLGATVNALRTVASLRPSARNVLICHSGGDAKRTPAYAAMGKAFVPMPDGRPLLAHIVDAMESLPAKSGVTVCCGDVIPLLDPSKVAFAASGVTGVAYPDGPWQAQRHGVYVVNPPAAGRRTPAVVDFLQKPKVSRGRFLIDTGIMHFDWTTAGKVAKLPVEGDIYEQFPALLLKGFAPFRVSVVPSCEFFHIGSSRELLKLLGGRHSRAFALVDGVEAPIKRLGGDNIVTNVPASYGPISLARGECLTSLPLSRGGKGVEWYHLKYNVDDTFKEDGLWEKHSLGDKMRRIDHDRLLAVRAASEKTVRVTAPVRIDFAGGWSDTPPVCCKEGGCVLAAAVTVDGRRPIEVVVSPRRDKLVKVVSKDLGKRKLLRSAAEIADHHDPHDWCCLAKAALSVTRFKFGSRGIDITLSSALPKGSGMGTSSILGAALIAALLGEVDVDRVGELTLRLEQEMRTGGGWEDQFAGMTPGVKLMRSKPGKEQKIEIAPVDMAKSTAALHKRSLLYFTGQKRMARNVLRRVLGFYAENPHGFGKILIDSVKKGARRAVRALEGGDIEAFASCVNDYWRDKKLLDAGSTNEKVDDIIDAIRPYASAISLAGAGGGGFMYILAKSAADARRIRSFLERNPPSPHSRFYDFAVDRLGMKMEVGA